MGLVGLSSQFVFVLSSGLDVREPVDGKVER